MIKSTCYTSFDGVCRGDYYEVYDYEIDHAPEAYAELKKRNLPIPTTANGVGKLTAVYCDSWEDVDILNAYVGLLDRDAVERADAKYEGVYVVAEYDSGTCEIIPYEELNDWFVFDEEEKL